ncbi:MAG: sulfatase [Verrucomicrobiota bacterium]
MRIILIDLDTVRPDRMSCYGHAAPTTPNIDRLCKRGVRFDRAYAADSPCVPSRASLLSGRFGVCQGCVDFSYDSQFFRHTPSEGRGFGERIMAELPLPEALFKQHVKCATISTFGRHPAAFYFRGWDEIIQPHEPDGPEYMDLFSEEQKRNHDPMYNPQYEGMQTVKGEEVVRLASEWLGRNASQEFFLHVQLWDPHAPYAPPAEDLALFENTPRNPHPTDENLPNVSWKGARTPEGMQKLMQHYDAGIHYADRQIGTLFNRCEELGLMEDTIFVVTSDHGEEFGERKMCCEHGSVREGTARIPLIIAGPNISPAVSRALVTNVDIAPTVLSLFDLPSPREWQGSSLAPLLENPEAKVRDELVVSHAVYCAQRALIRDRYKLIKTYKGAAPPVELFDLHEDPYEQCNLAESEPTLTGEMTKALEHWVKTMLRGRPDPVLQRLEQPSWFEPSLEKRTGTGLLDT